MELTGQLSNLSKCLHDVLARGHEQHSALPAEYTAEVCVLTGDDDLRPVT